MDNNLQDILECMNRGQHMVLARESVFIKEMKDVNARKIELEKILRDGKKKLKFLKDDSSMLANLAKEKDTVIRKLQQALASLPKDLRDDVEAMSRSNISGDGDACSMKRKSGELVREEARIMQTPNRKVPQRGAFQLSYESYSMKRKMKEPNAICSVTDKKSPFSSANNKVPRGFQHQPPPTPKSFKFGNKFSSIEELGSRPSPAESKGATSDSEHTEASMRTSFIHNSGNKKQAFLPRKSSVCSWQPQVSSTLRDRSQVLDSGCVAHQKVEKQSMLGHDRIQSSSSVKLPPSLQSNLSMSSKTKRSLNWDEFSRAKKGAMLNSGEMTMRRSSAPLKGEPPRFQFQDSDTSRLQSSWLGACAANRVMETTAPTSMNTFTSLAKSGTSKPKSQPSPSDCWKSTPGRIAREALARVQPAQLVKREERPLVEDVHKEAELYVAGRFRNEADAPLKGRSYQGDTPRKQFNAEPHIVIQNGLVIKSILKKRC